MLNPESEKQTAEVEVSLGDMLEDAYPYIDGVGITLCAGLVIAPVAMAIAGVAVPAALVGAGISGFWTLFNRFQSPD
jgi:hypothetical protein